MANVLPPEVQKRVWSFYRARFIFVGSITAIVTALVTIGALMPSYMYLLYTREPEQVTVQGVKIDASAESAQAARIKALLAGFSPLLAASSSPLSVIQHALQLRGAGITVQHITYSGGKNGPLVIIGSSASL